MKRCLTQFAAVISSYDLSSRTPSAVQYVIVLPTSKLCYCSASAFMEMLRCLGTHLLGASCFLLSLLPAFKGMFTCFRAPVYLIFVSEAFLTCITRNLFSSLSICRALMTRPGESWLKQPKLAFSPCAVFRALVVLVLQRMTVCRRTVYCATTLHSALCKTTYSHISRSPKCFQGLSTDFVGVIGTHTTSKLYITSICKEQAFMTTLHNLSTS